VTPIYRDVLVALGVKAKNHWRVLQDSAPLLGLTATPWRTGSADSKNLRRLFEKDLIYPEELGNRPISTLQEKGYLSGVKSKKLRVTGTRPMSADQQRRYEQIHDIPSDYLKVLAYDDERNATIISALRKLSKSRRVLVFACSIDHAETLTLALNQAIGPGCAAVITSETPRAERIEILERFRAHGDTLRFLCNVGVLTAGFDAPKVDVVCITRPTTSAIRYEQMVGRGLRGPKNGGTKECLVIDVQDEGLPADIQSYARVLEAWES
jgi:DNA repair protein RadD